MATIRQKVEASLLQLIVAQHPHLTQPQPLAAAATETGADEAIASIDGSAAPSSVAAAVASAQQAVDVLKERLRNLELEGLVVEVELPASGQGAAGAGKGGGPFSIDLSSLTGGALGGLGGAGQNAPLAISLERLVGSRKEKKKMTVAEVSHFRLKWQCTSSDARYHLSDIASYHTSR